MSGNVAAIIAAVGTLLTAVAVVLTAVGVLVPILRKQRTIQATAQTAVDKVSEVHTMVNQQRTDMLRYQAALIDVLRAASLPVPADQSLTAPPPTAGSDR